MKANEIRDLSLDEIKAKVKDLKEELFNLRMRLYTGQLDTPHKIREIKKDIARLKTIETEKGGFSK